MIIIVVSPTPWSSMRSIPINMSTIVVVVCVVIVVLFHALFRMSELIGDGDMRLCACVRRAGECLSDMNRRRARRALEKARSAADAWRDAVTDHVALLWETSDEDVRWGKLNLLGLGVRKGLKGRAREVPAAYLSALSVATSNAAGRGVRSAGQLTLGMEAVSGEASPLLTKEERQRRRKSQMHEEERAAISQASVQVSVRTANKLVRVYDCANYFASCRNVGAGWGAQCAAPRK